MSFASSKAPSGAMQRASGTQPISSSPSNRVLDVDVAAVHLEARGVLAASFLVVDEHEQVVAVELVPAGRQRGHVGSAQETRTRGRIPGACSA